MRSQEETYTRVYHSGRIEQLMATLCEPGGASLLLEQAGAQPQPVAVRARQADDTLLLDISAAAELAPVLAQGAGFRLLGGGPGGMLRTPVMILRHFAGPLRETACECDYPLYLEVMQRRETFRAPLRLGMDVGVMLMPADSEEPTFGDLKDLSLRGCLVECSDHVADRVSAPGAPLTLRLCFPDGSRLSLHGRPRHRRGEPERGVVLIGFEFEPHSAEVDRRLWFYVREIEQEAARYAESGGMALRPSALFVAKNPLGNPVSRRAGEHYATPMARRLARVAAFLDNQIMELRRGGRIGSVALSRQAERLIMLHHEDRQALLFAMECLHQETPLVRHGLAVAVRLLDMALAQRMPGDLCKAITAAALVHDLGKALLAPELLAAPRLDARQHETLHGHVSALRERLQDCRWLAPAVVEAVVGAINERLDGSGYPAGLAGDQLPALARLAAVVDVADALGRPRPDRAPWPLDQIQRHLLDNPERFDERWVKRYIEHFGRCPVGARVCFAGGEQGWVHALDAGGELREVWLSESPGPPDADTGRVAIGRELASLGEARLV